jgi:hypothetical protein
MAASGEVQATIARALCMEDGDRATWPCATCTGDAHDVLAALTEAGYFEASVARAAVEGLLAHLVHSSRTAIEVTVGHAYRTAAGMVEALLTTQTDDGAAASPVGDSRLPVPVALPEAAAPSSPRLFVLHRHTDVTGQSGTGVVAEGVQFSDLTAALRWRGGHPATAVWPNVEEILAVHGHSGATELVWLDKEPSDRICRACGCTDDTACLGGCYWVAEDLCSQCGDGPGVPT